MYTNKRSSGSIRTLALIIALTLLSAVITACGSSASSAELGVVETESVVAEIEVREISVDQAYKYYQEDVAFLDVRTQGEWDAAHIPGATLLPLDELEARVGDLPPDLEMVVYCRSDNRSAEAARILMEAGFSDVYSMDGGLNDWIEAGYEVDP
jgi:rhodanese-related sulfurtransferase